MPAPRRNGWLLLAAAILLAPTLLAGCQTVEGMGRDVQSAGEAVEDTSRDVRQ